MARRGENIYKRKDGRFEGRYQKENVAPGESSIGYVYGKTYKEAKEKLIKCKADAKKRKKKITSSGILVEDWFVSWLDNQKRIKKSSYTTYSSMINKHIIPRLGRFKLRELSTSVLQTFVDELSQTLAPKSVRAVFSVLRLGLKSAVENHLIDDIYHNVKLPKVKRKEVKVFEKQEQRQIEAYIENSDKLNDIGILICFYTGLRIGELCALDAKCIDLKRKILSVEKTLYRVKTSKGKGKTELQLSTPKSEAAIREIPLPKFLIDKLAMLPAIQNGSGFLINRNGKFIEPSVYARRYKKVLNELELPYRKFHATRHTFATRALEIGMDIKTLSEILGHASPTVTLNLYSHSLPEHKRKEMERLGKLYNPSK